MTEVVNPRVATLEKQIMMYKKLYYSGQPTVPDAVYDALEDELRRLSPDSPILEIVGPGEEE